MKQVNWVVIWVVVFASLAIVGLFALFGWYWLIVLAAYVFLHFAGDITALKRIRFKDVINPRKWFSVFYSFFISKVFPLHILEQMVLRVYDNECRNCVKNGTCFSCGCDMSKVFSPYDECTEGNWGWLIFPEGDYLALREEYPVEISIKHIKEEEEKDGII